MDVVEDFYRRFPPANARPPPPKEVYDSFKPTLEDVGRPTIRLTTPHEIPDDTVPPILRFRDVEILHQRLVLAEATQTINRLTWMLKNYDGALRTRMKSTITTPAPDQSETHLAVPF